MKKILTILLVVLSFGLVLSSCGGESKLQKEARDESSQVGKGWKYLKEEVIKRPATAELLDYVGPEEAICKELAKQIDIQGLSLAMYHVNSANSYGDMQEAKLIVFFINGEPVLGDKGEEFTNRAPSTIRNLINFAVSMKK